MSSRTAKRELNVKFHEEGHQAVRRSRVRLEEARTIHGKGGFWAKRPESTAWVGRREERCFRILLERPFSLQILAKTVHQVGAESPTFRFLHVWISKMFPNFLKAFLRLLIPLQPLGLL